MAEAGVNPTSFHTPQPATNQSKLQGNGSAETNSAEALVGRGVEIGSNQEIRTRGGNRVKVNECFKHNKGNVDKCRLCNKDIKLNVDVWAMANCSHRFHFECIRKSLEQAKGNARCCFCNYSIKVLHRFSKDPPPLPSHRIQLHQPSNPTPLATSGSTIKGGRDVPYQEPSRDNSIRKSNFDEITLILPKFGSRIKLKLLEEDAKIIGSEVQEQRRRLERRERERQEEEDRLREREEQENLRRRREFERNNPLDETEAFPKDADAIDGFEFDFQIEEGPILNSRNLK